MAILDQLSGIPGMSFIQNIDLNAFISKIGNFLLIVFLLLIICGIIIWIAYSKSEKKKYKNKIHWFEEVKGDTVPIDDDLAKEMTIPNTNLTIFYIKTKDMYLPRGVIRMGKDAFWYGIKNNREIINFSLGSINERGEAKPEYDHTDMRYAHTNLRDLIKRNYRDKSTKWWQEYKDVIATVIFIFVMGLAFYFLLGKINTMIGGIEPLMTKLNEIASNINQILVNSQQYLSGSGIR
jgi:cbb3-type cytochrome oxidase subunit 3